VRDAQFLRIFTGTVSVDRESNHGNAKFKNGGSDSQTSEYPIMECHSSEMDVRTRSL
jgi:hypothetical protein